jgi:hypothetical protein
MELTREQRMEIANTIIQQFGGPGRLKAMAGCKDFMAIDGGVQFGIGRNAAGINKCIVRLTEADLYDVEFGVVRRVKGVPTYKVVDSTRGAYADMLKGLFERATGMYLTF